MSHNLFFMCLVPLWPGQQRKTGMWVEGAREVKVVKDRRWESNLGSLKGILPSWLLHHHTLLVHQRLHTPPCNIPPSSIHWPQYNRLNWPSFSLTWRSQIQTNRAAEAESRYTQTCKRQWGICIYNTSSHTRCTHRYDRLMEPFTKVSLVTLITGLVLLCSGTRVVD